MAIHRDRDGQIKPIDDGFEAPTRPVRRPEPEPEPAAQAPPPVPSSAKPTRLFRGEGVEAGGDEAAQNPVVGWLVITGGPGRGRALPLGYGMNSIGRGPSSRVQLDFGDRQISRDEHAAITYDPKGRRFYLQHGGGTNLTYLNEQPVLIPVELQGREVIQLGQTQLHFVPFCGPDFDWQGDGG